MNNDVAVITYGDGIAVTSPYNPEFVKRAKDLNGRFHNARWAFDARDEGRVRELCRELFGTDGTATETVTVRINLDKYPTDYATAWFCGRQLAHRHARDSRPRLGHNVVVVAGGFDSSGGSMKNPRLDAKAGTVLEVRDVPTDHSKPHPDFHCDGVTVVDRAVNREALAAERAQLIDRIAEIDKRYSPQCDA